MQGKLDTSSTNFGLRLRAFIEQHGTVEGAYRAIGVSRATLFNWFQRDRPPPGKEMQEKLRQYLDREADWVIFGRHNADHLNLGGFPQRVEEPRSLGSAVVASRFTDRKSPATRKECEDYFTQLMDAADLCEDPNAFPVILHRLKKEFPLDEWPPAPPKED